MVLVPLLPAAWLFRAGAVLCTPGPDAGAEEHTLDVAVEELAEVVEEVEEEEEVVDDVEVAAPLRLTPNWFVIEDTRFRISSGVGADPPALPDPSAERESIVIPWGPTSMSTRSPPSIGKPCTAPRFSIEAMFRA